MEFTAKILHPKFPSLVTTIRYLGRSQELKQRVELDQVKVPYAVLHPVTRLPLLDGGGNPLVVWKAELPKNYTAESMAAYIVGFEGFPFKAEDTPPVNDNLELLLDQRLDVQVEIEIEENGQKVKKTITMPWAMELSRQAKKLETFTADPFVSSSATP